MAQCRSRVRHFAKPDFLQATKDFRRKDDVGNRRLNHLCLLPILISALSYGEDRLLKSTADTGTQLNQAISNPNVPDCNHNTESPAKIPEKPASVDVCLLGDYHADAATPNHCKPFRYHCGKGSGVKSWGAGDLMIADPPTEGAGKDLQQLDQGHFTWKGINDPAIGIAGLEECSAALIADFDCQALSLAHIAGQNASSVFSSPKKKLASEKSCAEKPAHAALFLLLSETVDFRPDRKIDDIYFNKIVCDARTEYPLAPIYVLFRPKTDQQADGLGVTQDSRGKVEITDKVLSKENIILNIRKIEIGPNGLR